MGVEGTATRYRMAGDRGLLDSEASWNGESDEDGDGDGDGDGVGDGDGGGRDGPCGVS